MPKRPRAFGAMFLVTLLGLLLLAPMLMAQPLKELPYHQFVQDVSDGQVERATISGRTLTAGYRSGESYRVYLPGGDPTTASFLTENGVDVAFQQSSTASWASLLVAAFLPILLLGGLIWYLTSQGSGSGAGQVFSFGQSRARLYTPGDRQVTMRDVAGMPEVKEELWEVVDFLRHPERYQELGARIPKGILLYGPPGTGKTLLAKAVAGEAGVPFFAISGSDFVEIFAGVGASRVRDLFTKARSQAPCIIFVDEIDAVGRQRGVSLSGGSDEREQTLNQLLVEMDGFGTQEGIIVMAATNRLDILDTAILRPGRFDRQIGVDLPDRQGRREILQVHALGKPLADDADLDRAAAMTTGFTGADLANLLNEAALLAARVRKRAIGMAEIRGAFERVVTGGPDKKRTMSAPERVRVAFHEAGHAVVSRRLEHADPIEKISIVPRGRALGYVMYRPAEEKHMHSRSEMRERIISLLGGRAAEEVVLGEVSSGAADDLERATALARQMVTELGMHHAIGPVSIKPEPPPAWGMMGRPISDRTAVAVDEAVRQLVLDAYARAVELVRANREALDKIAGALLERETLDGQEVERLVSWG